MEHEVDETSVHFRLHRSHLHRNTWARSREEGKEHLTVWSLAWSYAISAT